MKRLKALYIISMIALSLTACGKDYESAETPAIEETTAETSEDMDCVTNADRGTAVGEVIDNTEITEDNLINEPLELEDRLLEGFDEMLANGEITQEEYNKLVGSIDEAIESVPDISKEEQSEEEMFKEWLDNGEITQDEYDQLMNGEADKGYDEIIIGDENTEDTHIPAPLPEGATYADPSQDEEITFGDAEVPEHLQGKVL